MNEWMNSLISIFIILKITALQIIHNNRRKENGIYQKSLKAYLSWKTVILAMWKLVKAGFVEKCATLNGFGEGLMPPTTNFQSPLLIANYE